MMALTPQNWLHAMSTTAIIVGRQKWLVKNSENRPDSSFIAVRMASSS